MLVDAHTHTWGADTDELPWTEPVLPPGWSGTYTHEELIADMDRIGVDEAVVVSNPTYGRGPRANEYTMRSIEAHPDRLYGVGHTDYFGTVIEGSWTGHDDPTDESAVRERVRQVVGHKRMLGVRLYAAMAYAEIPDAVDRTGEWIRDDALEPVYDELARRDASCYLFPKAEQLEHVAAVAEAHPDLSIVVDHVGWPDETTAPDEPPWTDFERVADLPNTHVKVSSLPRSADSDYPYPDLHGYVRNLLDWFGPERLILGSDYPWMDDWASYEECLRWVGEADWLSARDAAWLQYRSFDRLHGVSR